MANGTLGFVTFADAYSTLHAKKVVPAGHQCSCDLAFETYHALPASRNRVPSGIEFGEAWQSISLVPPWQASKAGFWRPLRGISLDGATAPRALLLGEDAWGWAVVLLSPPHGSPSFGHTVIHVLLVVGEQVAVVEFVLIVQSWRLVNGFGRTVADAAQAILSEGGKRFASGCRTVHSPALWISAFHAGIWTIGQKVILIVVFQDFSGSYRNMSLNFFPCPFHISRSPCDLKHRVSVAAWSDNISVCLLLNSLNGSPLGSNY